MMALQEIAARRGRLAERAGNERAEIARRLAPLAAAGESVQRAWPLAAAALALVLVARPKSAVRWLRYALFARQAWRLLAGKA